MGQHGIPADHRYSRTAILATALAAGAIYAALAGAGAAEAKTHHGVNAPGNPFGASQTAAGYLGSSFTMVRIVRGAQGGVTTVGSTTNEVVASRANTTVRSSGGLVSGRGLGTTTVTGTSGSTSGTTTGTSGSTSRGTTAGTTTGTSGSTSRGTTAGTSGSTSGGTTAGSHGTSRSNQIKTHH